MNVEKNTISTLLKSLIMPPVLGGIITGIDVYKTKNYSSILRFTFFYCMILVYTMVSYDNRLRFWDIMSYTAGADLTDTHILSWLVYFVNIYVGIDATCFFLLYTFLGLYLYIYCAKKEYGELDTCLCIVMLMGISLRNIYDLNYYTLSSTYALFILLCVNGYKKYLLLILGCYIIHPGVLPIALLSIPLMYLIENERWTLSYLYIGLIVAIGGIIFVADNTLATFGFAALDNYTMKAQGYMESENYWGAAEQDARTYSFIGRTLYYIQYLAYILIALGVIYSYKKKVVSSALLSLIIVSGIFYISTLEFLTLNERFTLDYYVFGILALPKMVEFIPIRALNRKVVQWLCILLYLNSLYYQPLVQRDIFGTKGFDSTISFRKYYLPTGVLLDIHDFGASDEYLKSNMIPHYSPR